MYMYDSNLPTPALPQTSSSIDLEDGRGRHLPLDHVQAQSFLAHAPSTSLGKRLWIADVSFARKCLYITIQDFANLMKRK